MKVLLIGLLLLNISCNKDEPKLEDGFLGDAAETSGGTTTGGTVTETKTIEFISLINNHRISLGLKALIHDEELADIATTHSANMATGVTPFGHDGFSERCAEGTIVLNAL